MARKRRGGRGRRGTRGCKGPVRSAVARCAKRGGSKRCSSAIKRASRACVGYAKRGRRSRGRSRRRAARNIQAAASGWF